MATNLNLAQAYAWSLAKTLMVCVTLFRSEAGYAVLPSNEFDGEPSQVIHEFDPFER